MKRYLPVFLFFISLYGNSQIIENGTFQSPCNGYAAFLHNCVPYWKVSHGSPDVFSVPYRHAHMAGGKGFVGLGGGSSGSEGIFQEYTFHTGNKYYLKLKVEGSHDDDLADYTVDHVFVALTSDLVAKDDDDQVGDYNVP